MVRKIKQLGDKLGLDLYVNQYTSEVGDNLFIVKNADNHKMIGVFSYFNDNGIEYFLNKVTIKLKEYLENDNLDF